MRKTLYNGFVRFEILEPGETDLEFKDLSGAVAFLQRFKKDPAQMAILRDFVGGNFPGGRAQDPEEVLALFASMLVSSQVRILKSPGFRGRGVGSEAGAGTKSKEKTSAPKTAGRKRSWIEIYLRDTEGNPVPGQRFRIKLPDGSTEEGMLDAYGYAEYNDINPGTCEVCFPDLDANEWNRA